MAELTLAMSIVIGCSIFAFTLLLAFLAYLDYKKSKDRPERKPDPILKAFMFTVAFFILLFVAYWLGWVEEDWAKKYGVAACIGMGVLIGALYWVIIRKRMPLNLSQQISLMNSVLRRIFNAEEYKGFTNILPLDAYTTSSEGKRPNVGTIMCTRKCGTMMPFIVRIDRDSKEIVALRPNPPETVKDELLKLPFSEFKDVVGEEFNTVDQNGNENKEKNH